MGKYILKRIVWFIPTLFIITLLGFIITVSSPGDPVDSLLKAADNQGENSSGYSNTEAERQRWRHRLGLDLPLFYIQIGTAAEPDTLYRIADQDERYALKRLCRQFGSWKEISAYYLHLKNWHQQHFALRRDTALLNKFPVNAVNDAINESTFRVLSLPGVYRMDVIRIQLRELQNIYDRSPFLRPLQDKLDSAVVLAGRIESGATPFKTWMPSVHIHPMNKYHRWFFGDGNMITGAGSVYSKGIIRGDFGLSYSYMEPVGNVIRRRIGWSLFFTLFSIIMGYIVSIPIGLKAARRRDGPFDRFSSVGLFILYSVPNFFMATMLQMIFANVDQFNWFETTGVKPVTGYPPDAGFLEKARITLPYLVLPAICYTYSTFAFLSRTMRVSVLEILGQDYIRTARAKGLPEQKVLWRHAFRNALLPIITVFANLFPLVIGGSVILEYIFGIPGMGQESYMAISRKDYPVIVAVFTLTGLLTLAGYLISDVLYAWADPRISYRKRG